MCRAVFPSNAWKRRARVSAAAPGPGGGAAEPTVALIAATENEQSRRSSSSSTLASSAAKWRLVRPLFKSYRSVGGHGEAKAARAGARSTHLRPDGGAHEQQHLDGGRARLPPLLQLRAPVRAQVLQILQLFDDGVVGHAGCVERGDAWRRREEEGGTVHSQTLD